MKIYYKWTALMIALSVIMCSIPMTALASDVDLSVGDVESYVEKNGHNADVEKELKEKKGLGIVEIESLREKHTKHYQMSDGTYQALSFGAPIHRKGADGKWEDINNRLYKENDYYRTKDGWFSFAADLSSGEIYTVNSEEYSFTVSYALSVSKSVSRAAPAQTPLAVVENHEEKTSLSACKTDAEKMEAIVSIDNTTRVFYKDVYEGVDFEYTISSNDVKENIILNTNSGKHEFVFYIEMVGLKAKTESDGSIQLLDVESEECIYCIPAPYMYDSEGDCSYNVRYLLSEKSNGRYEIKIIADESWLNSSGTVYPVVIDPTITELAMFDTYINSSYPTTNYGGSEQLWVSSGRITYIRTPMPSLPEYARINYATLTVKYYYNDTVTSGNVRIGLYQCLKSWNEYGLTWNGANSWTNYGLSTTRSALTTATATETAHAATPGTISFNVYELVKQWYAGQANYGVGLKYESGTNTSVILGAFEAGSDYRAKFSITYTIVTPVVENGTYFIQNGHLKNYLQIDDECAPDYSEEDAILELFDFDGGDYQKWNITFLHNGYYKVASAQSGKVISVQEGEEDEGDVSLRMTTYTASANQQWAISVAHDGQYKFSPKSSVGYSTDWCMAAGSAVIESITDGRNVQQREYTDNTGYKDEWLLAYIEYESSVVLEGQQKSQWCWATSARMFSRHTYDSVTYTQAEAVTYVKGSAINEGGTREEAKMAINYYISNISGASIDTVIKEYCVYSEDTLVRFLDDGHVIYIARRWYSDISDPAGYTGGHATLIYGYAMMGSEILFLVKDPLPVDEGEMCVMSYEKLYNGRNNRDGEDPDTGIWYASIVINTDYANDTVPYYFNE